MTSSGLNGYGKKVELESCLKRSPIHVVEHRSRRSAGSSNDTVR